MANHFTVGAVARALNRSPSRVRQLEKVAGIQPERASNGARLYTPQQVEQLRKALPKVG